MDMNRAKGKREKGCRKKEMQTGTDKDISENGKKQRKEETQW